MSKNNEPNHFFGDDESKDKELIIEVPVEPRYPYPEKIPSGFEPMESIHLRGRVYGNLAMGRVPWWVIITSWLLIGIPAIVMCISLVEDISTLISLFTYSDKISFSKAFVKVLLSMLPLAFLALIASIVWKGTLSKFHTPRSRRIFRDK